MPRADGNRPRRAARRSSRVALVLSCEHGGNQIPAPYRRLFVRGRRELDSHRGWDPGALELARALARACRAPLVATTTSRLLVECNRSLDHPRLFSAFTRTLSRDEKERILARHYHPHRRAVETAVRRALRGADCVIHIGVHTFTPVLDGRRRDADIGLLYDPRRTAEPIFCEVWMEALRRVAPGLRVRRNYPYRGWTDGLVTTLRGMLPPARYVGIELEVNQTLAAGPAARRDAVHGALGRALALILAR